MTYSEAVSFLYSLSLFGTRLGLENSFRLAAMCGNPHEKLRFIHVAGTNGKGSTCAMLESIYRHAGCKTGLFTSPHLISFTERIQVQRRNISEAQVARWTERILDALGGRDPAGWPFKPTFFEFAAIMGLLHFAEEGCELVIWETGLGGRLDATNIVTPLASVITNIQFDHQQWLGTTLPEIAAEKAGIIKPRIPVITATRDKDALAVIRARARELEAPLTVVERPAEMKLSLLGEHQKWNAAVAIETARVLDGEIPAEEGVVRRALASTFWPGRLQVLEHSRGRVLLDGAHNPDGAATLAAALRTQFAAVEKGLVIGFFKDKPWRQICDHLLPECARVVVAPVQSERAEEPSTVAAYCQQAFPNLQVTMSGSLKEALDQSLGASLTVVTGSLHFVGEALEILGQGSGPSSRELNEWDAAREKSR